MSALSNRLKKARELRIQSGAYTFIVRRPTSLEMSELRGTIEKTSRGLLPYVIGWEGVKESDLMPTGDPIAVEFDAEACALWLEDRPDILLPIITEVYTAYNEHAKSIEDATKN